MNKEPEVRRVCKNCRKIFWDKTDREYDEDELIVCPVCEELQSRTWILSVL